MATLYDEVLYPNNAYPQTHPLRLSALATLMGAPSAPFQTCRVLEAACGDGANLFGMALAAPRASFVGLDLAEAPIRRGQGVVKGLGLTNLRLETRDLREPGHDLGEFDYLIAHGVYAWVPASVRQALMALAGRVLSPAGLAFISYNAMPGGRVRQILRDLLLGGLRDFQGDTAGRVGVARALLQQFVEQWSAEDPLQKALAGEARRMLKRAEAVLFHDELSEVYEPQYLTDVVELAADHGLAYLCDAQPENADSAPDATEGLSAQHRLRAEQLADFLRPKFFRASVFQRAGAGQAADGADWRALRGLHGHAPLKPARPKTGEPGAEAFATPAEQSFETAHPRMIGLLHALADAHPGSVALEPWLTDDTVGSGVLRLFRSGVLTLLSEPFQFARVPGDRPRASPLARWQALQGLTELTGLDQSTVRITDGEALRFITLLDGEQDRASLARRMFGDVASEHLAFIEARLADLAGIALLSA